MPSPLPPRRRLRQQKRFSSFSADPSPSPAAQASTCAAFFLARRALPRPYSLLRLFINLTNNAISVMLASSFLGKRDGLVGVLASASRGMCAGSFGGAISTEPPSLSLCCAADDLRRVRWRKPIATSVAFAFRRFSSYGFIVDSVCLAGRHKFPDSCIHHREERI